MASMCPELSLPLAGVRQCHRDRPHSGAADAAPWMSSDSASVETGVFFLQTLSDSMQSPEGLVGVRWANKDAGSEPRQPAWSCGGGRSTPTPVPPPADLELGGLSSLISQRGSRDPRGSGEVVRLGLCTPKNLQSGASSTGLTSGRLWGHRNQDKVPSKPHCDRWQDRPPQPAAGTYGSFRA